MLDPEWRGPQKPSESFDFSFTISAGANPLAELSSPGRTSQQETRPYVAEIGTWVDNQLLPALSHWYSSGFSDSSPVTAAAKTLPFDAKDFLDRMDRAKGEVARIERIPDSFDRFSPDFEQAGAVVTSLNDWLREFGTLLTIDRPVGAAYAHVPYQFCANQIDSVWQLRVPEGSTPCFDLFGQDLGFQGRHDSLLRLAYIYPAMIERELAQVRSSAAEVGTVVSQRIDQVAQEGVRVQAVRLNQLFPGDEQLRQYLLTATRREESYHSLDNELARAYAENGQLPVDSGAYLRLLNDVLVQPSSKFSRFFSPRVEFSRDDCLVRTTAILELSADFGVALSETPGAVTAKWLRDLTMMELRGSMTGGVGYDRNNPEGIYGLGTSLGVIACGEHAQLLKPVHFNLNNPEVVRGLIRVTEALHDWAVLEPEQARDLMRVARNSIFVPHYDPARAELQKIARFEE